MLFLFWYNILIILGMLCTIPYFFVENNQQRKKHLVIFLILAVISLVEVLGKHLSLLGQNNTIIYNIGYVLIGLSLKIFFFYLVFIKSKEKAIVLYLIAFFVLWCVLNFLFYQTFGVFHHYSLVFGSLLILGLCFYYFHGIFFKNWYAGKNLIEVPEFWIISFFMFFYSASFLFFISFSFFYEKMEKDLILQLNLLIKILGATMYMVMGLAFYAPLLFKKVGN